MGKAEYLAWHQSVYEHYDTITFQPLAVRGRQLCLMRVVLARDGFESLFVMLVRLDDDGLIAEYVNFDEDDLASAQDGLDARFIEGEGAPSAAMLRTKKANNEAFEADDLVAMSALIAPGLTFVDHRRLGWQTGVDQAAATVAAYDDVQKSFLVTKQLVGRAATLDSHVSRGIDPHGNDVVWLFHAVCGFDREARYSSTDWYDADDWDAALARFDDLAVAGPTMENGAVRALARLAGLIAASDRDRLALYPEDAVCDDRRTGVNSGVSVGREAIVDLWRGLEDVGFDAVTQEVLAIRGDHLALARRHLTRTDGFGLQLLTVVEVDTNERFAVSVLFDADDVAAAMQELDARYLAGEGAVLDNAAVRALVRHAGSFAARDWDEMVSLCSDDIVNDDRRTGVSSGVMTGIEVVFDLTRGLADVGFVSVAHEVLAVRGAYLALVQRRWARNDGFELALLSVVEVNEDGLYAANVMFDADDLDAAMRELDERAARLGESA